jgi:hypothetical protein
MDVDIDEAGAGDEAAGVDLFRAFFGGGGERGNEVSVGDEEIAQRVAFGGGIDDAGVFNPEEGHRWLKFQTTGSKRQRNLPDERRIEKPVGGESGFGHGNFFCDLAVWNFEI